MIKLNDYLSCEPYTNPTEQALIGLENLWKIYYDGSRNVKYPILVICDYLHLCCDYQFDTETEGYLEFTKKDKRVILYKDLVVPNEDYVVAFIEEI